MAIELLQLHDLKNNDARGATVSECSDSNRILSIEELPAVDVKQKATPAMAELAIVPKTPAKGRDRRRPISLC